MHYAELFAGAGGMSIGLEAAGWTCVAHAEIEPHARAVLRKRWPDVPLYGDVTQLDGRQFKGITMLTGGSPCQDLSIAGKRAGMTEGSGTRSSLFFEQMRIWRESEAPLVLWENVMGAFSSNGGQDFGAVLSTIVGGTVVVPADGWRNAGVASGPTGVAAWRSLDLQHFGWDGHTTPQRRRRVFVLGARTGTLDPAQVLLVADGLLGHLEKGEQASKNAAPATGAGAAVAVNISNAVASRDLIMGTLDTDGASTTAIGAQTRGVVLTYDARGNGEGAIATAFNWQSGGDVRLEPNTEQANTLQANQTQAIVLRNREGKPGGGKGPLLSEGKSLTLGTANDQVVFTRQRTDEFADGKGVVSTISARDYKSASNDITGNVGIPRRLMPVECERLMGWPSGWTERGIDEQGREYALSDTARYKLCGNGCGGPVLAWIGLQLARVLDKKAP